MLEADVYAIGRAIRGIRRGRMSIEALASRSGVSVGLLSQLENGQGNPTMRVLCKIAEALQIEVTDLVQSRQTYPTKVTRARDRLFKTAVGNVEVEVLTPSLAHTFSVTRSRLEPGETRKLIRRSGHVCLLVESGTLTVSDTSGGETVLPAGDAVTCDIELLTRFGGSPAEQTLMISVFLPDELQG